MKKNIFSRLGKKYLVLVIAVIMIVSSAMVSQATEIEPSEYAEPEVTTIAEDNEEVAEEATTVEVPEVTTVAEEPTLPAEEATTAAVTEPESKEQIEEETAKAEKETTVVEEKADQKKEKKTNDAKSEKKDTAEKVIKEETTKVTVTESEPKTKAIVKEKQIQQAAFSLRAADVDNTTGLADGEYTDFEYEWYITGGRETKSKLELLKIVVNNGRATGYFSATSKNMTHVYYLGHTSSDVDDPNYYDPSKDACGTGVKPITGQAVNFPVVLNKDTYVSGRTVAMTDPHWVHYTYKITINEEDKDIVTTLTLNNNMQGLGLSGAAFIKKEVSGKERVELTAENKNFTKIFLGTAAEAEKDASSAIEMNADNVFVLQNTDKIKNTTDIAFYSAKDEIWHEGTVSLNVDKKTLTLNEGNKADYSGVEAAKKKVPADLSIYKESRVKVLEDALAAVKEGLYASEQDRVNAFAQDIENAIAALEKEKLTIKFRALDKETGKVISGAVIEVKDAKGKTVKADKAGEYSLEEGSYNIKATAKNYEDATLNNFSPKVEKTIDLKLAPKEIIPPGTIIFKENEKDPSKTNLFNTTAMFKVIKGVLVSKQGKTTLTVTLNGQGYHNLFKGTYEEAMANGLKKKNWIKGTKNKDGKLEFTIPIDQSETFIPLVAISASHLEKVEKGEEDLGYALYPRQIVLDLKKNTLTAGDYDQKVGIKVISKSEKCKVVEKSTMVVVGGPNSNNYACKPVIKMQDNLFTKAFIGTAANAKKAGAGIIKPKSGAFNFSFVNSFSGNGQEKMFEDKKPIAIAFYDSKLGKWVDYKLTIDKAASTVTLEALKKDEAPPEKPTQDNKDKDKNGEGDKYKDDSNVGTGAVDNNTTLKDGTYTPTSFRFSGGTGRIKISCTKVEVKDGQAYATIHFSKANGGESSVDSLRANGGVYSGFNIFTIPVNLNTNNTVVARTTAMSQPHWIEYTIYIELAEPDSEDARKNGEEASALSEKTTDLDNEAPEIIGLKAKGETEASYTDLVKVFSYEEGYYLIEVDAVRDTARDELEYQTEAALKELRAAKEQKSEKEEETTEAVTESEAAEEGESVAQESISEKIAKLYENEIIKYLVIPERKEVPAGLDKEVIIIKQPAEKTLITSAEAMQMLAQIGVDNNIAASGIDVSKIKDDSLKKTVEALPNGGTYDKWDLRLMIKDKIDLAIESSEILPKDKKTMEEDMSNMIRLGERAAQLDLAMFIDRSADEDNELAKAEWLKVYGIIFSVPDKAEQLYKDVINSASANDKKEAEKRLEKRADEKEKIRKAALEAAKKQEDK